VDGTEVSAGKKGGHAGCRKRRIRPRRSLRLMRTGGGQPQTAPLASIQARNSQRLKQLDASTYVSTSILA
jgi:hypothetical protein